jgi:integrase
MAPRQFTHYDLPVSGLGIRRNGRGKTVYCFKYRLNGKQYLKTIGQTRFFTELRACEVATRMYHLAKAGKDPMVVLHELYGPGRKGCQSAYKISDMFEWYFKTHARPYLKTRKNLENCYRAYIEPEFGSRNVDSITRSEVQIWHAKLGTSIGVTTANKAMELLRAAFNKAIQDEIIARANPAMNIRKFKLQSRKRFLQPNEIELFLNAVDSLANKTSRDFFLMLLYTGARLSNVMAMRWDEISLSRKTWEIPMTKNGTTQVVPIIEPAMKVLEKRAAESSSPWVFPTNRPTKTGHIACVDTAWAMVKEKSGLENLRMHDLRRTLGSWQAMNGSNVSIIAASLGHKDLNSTAIYAQLDTASVGKSMNAAIANLLENGGRLISADTI